MSAGTTVGFDSGPGRCLDRMLAKRPKKMTWTQNREPAYLGHIYKASLPQGDRKGIPVNKRLLMFIIILQRGLVYLHSLSEKGEMCRPQLTGLKHLAIDLSFPSSHPPPAPFL